MRCAVLSFEDAVACGPLLSLALEVEGSFGTVGACRGRRSPARAPAVAVAAARRLHCAARSGVAPPNSLRSLRSLRSNNRGESVVEARWRAPTPALRCSSPPKSRPAGSPCREAHGCWCSRQPAPRWLQRRVRAGCGAPVRRRGAQGSWPRAQRASTSDSSRLFERRERSERSELSDGPRDRAPQGSRRKAATASAKRRGLPARAFARADRRTQCGRFTTATGRDQSAACPAASEATPRRARCRSRDGGSPDAPARPRS
jgi:hypothetical protein